MSVKGVIRMVPKIFGNEDQRSKAFDNGYKEKIRKRIDYYFAWLDLEINWPGTPDIIKNHFRFLMAMRSSIAEDVEEKFLEECSHVVESAAAIAAFVCLSDQESRWFKDEPSHLPLALSQALANSAATLPLWMLKLSLLKLNIEVRRAS